MSGPRRDPADRLVVVAMAFMTLYLAVVVVNGPTKPERYPFFSWSLFSKMPAAEVTDYSIRFTRIDGKDLDEPIYFEDANALVGTSGVPGAIDTIRNLGKSLVADRPMQVAVSEERLETTYLNRLVQADYEIVRRRFDILERRSCDCFLSVTVIGQGSFG